MRQDHSSPPASDWMVTLRARTVAASLIGAMVVVLLLHAASQVLRFGFGLEYQMGFHDRVYLGAELSIPTWFSSSVMLLCGLVLLWIARATARQGGSYVWHWTVLGGIFVMLSMDEAAALHELLSPMFAGTMSWLAERVGGPLVPLADKGDRYAWIIPGAAATLVVGLLYLPFVRALPPATRRLFIAAGAIFVTGALGLEAAGGRYSGLHGADNVTFVAIMTLEEMLEKAGICLFLYALLRHAESAFGAIQIGLTAPAASSRLASG